MIALGLLLLALALLGAPLFAVIAASALLGFGREQVDLSVVAIEVYRLAEMPALVAIPLFTFAGYVLGESQAPDRLVRLTHALLGWLRGGLGIVSLASCALFTALTGASGVTIVALGALLYPALRLPRAATGRLPRALQPRAGHDLGEPGAALRSRAAADPLRRGGAADEPGAARADRRRLRGRAAARPADARRAVAVDRVAAPR
jgi:hypothetical protein